MESNFSFLSAWPEIYDKALQVEKNARKEPRTSLMYARMALETAIKWMYHHDDELELPYDKSLSSLMSQQAFKDQFNRKLNGELHLIRKSGNIASHGSKVSAEDSLTTIENLFYFLRWFAKSYGDVEESLPENLDCNTIPDQDEVKISRRQVQLLQEKLAQQSAEYEKQLQEEKERLKKLKQENQLYKKQTEEKQATFKLNKEAANTADVEKHPRSEQETREQFIDLALREAGWDINAANVKEYKVKHMPESTNSSGIGYVDYVLWNDDGLPLAVVEAKKAMENPQKGENQAQLYADALEKTYGQRPVMFYSNGYEIYMWDDQFYRTARFVNGFYTKTELQTLLFRRNNRKDIRKIPVDTEIAGRTYQMRSIKSIAEHLAGTDKSSGQLIGTNRAALLVLATGTGKTRTAIAFSKLLLEANWAKRILFLADRISLVKQAKANFVKQLPDHSCVNLIEEKDNPEARFAFSTYQTIIRLIDGSRDEEQRIYGVGHFDLIIIDEAHRSIYQKYKSIFEYFDAILLGLTATPKGNIHHNTYQVFGLPDKTPTDAYSFDEAVNDGFLVPYKTIAAPTKFLRSGITYGDLSDEEKEAFEDEILDGEEATGNEHIPETDLNAWLFNIDTAKKTINFFLKHGIKKRGGDEIGKTIIFARNQNHARFLKDMFLEMDKERFGNDYVKVITNSEPKAQEFIERFCDESRDILPQIVISVDMMDTGIDAPSCVNLIFYKPVKSYTKFWQMIGRGSRLRPDLFGPGEDKDHFLIIDLLGNFEFFEENPKGIEPTLQKSITEIVFELKIRLAQYLDQKTFQEDEELQAFRKELLDELHENVASLDTDRFDVRMQLKHVLQYGDDHRELWEHLSKKDIKILIDHIAPLIPPNEEETDLARFYDKLLYHLMIERLETPNSELFKEKLSIPITKVATLSQKLLKKTTIPEVKYKLDIIKMPLDESFWLNDGLKHLEKIRLGIRNLLVYIDKEDQRYVTTDFIDELNEDDTVITDYTSKSAAKNTKNQFTNNLKRLEKLLEEHKDHMTIRRIRDGKSISTQELQALEKMLFSESLSKESIEAELGGKLILSKLIVSLFGLSKEHVDKAFADFINEYKLSSTQTEFLNTIKKFLTKNGQINPEKLYDSPFKTFDPQGVDGVFREEQANKLFEIITSINNENSSA